MLHRHCVNKKIKEIIESNYKKEDFVKMLLNLSKFEYSLKTMLTNLVT